MADAWGGSWGTSWGDSWGSVAAVPTSSGDAGPRRRRRNNRLVIYFDHEDIPEAVEPVRRKITRKIVAEAITKIPSNPWTIAAAQDALPAAVWTPKPDEGHRISDADMALAVAHWLKLEAKRLADEQDEEEVTMLLLMN
jgi:hypothetical protein